MDPKTLILDALRSHEYTQCQSMLRCPDSEPSYCAMGVIIDTYIKHHLADGVDHDEAWIWFDGYEFLPREVVEWAFGPRKTRTLGDQTQGSLYVENPTADYPGSEDGHWPDEACVAEFNDSDGLNFKEIATILEAEWDNLVVFPY